MGTLWDINLYRDGACVYQVDAQGDDVQLVAWARNQLAALAAFAEITARDPGGGYVARHRGRVLAERHRADYVPREQWKPPQWLIDRDTTDSLAPMPTSNASKR